MRKIYKAVILVDLILLIALLVVLYTGCYLGREGKNRLIIEEKHRLVFKVYNNVDMLFAQDNLQNNHINKKTMINLPNINIIVADIPTGAHDIQSILNLHHSVSLGFLPGTHINTINRALYNGHKTYRKIYIGEDGIDLTLSEQQNIDNINRILAQGDYDGIYMSWSDTKSLDRYPNLSKKISGSLSFITVDDTVCYKNQICYISSNVSIDEIRNIITKVSMMSEVGGKWTIIFSYGPNIANKVIDSISMISTSSSQKTK